MKENKPGGRIFSLGNTAKITFAHISAARNLTDSYPKMQQDWQLYSVAEPRSIGTDNLPTNFNINAF